MKTDECLLVAFANYEARSVLGFGRDLERVGIRSALVFYFGSDHKTRTGERLDAVEAVCRAKDIELTLHRLDVDAPASSWRTVLEAVDAAAQSNRRHALVDISTMPREVIWYVLWRMDGQFDRIDYVYHTPRDYMGRGSGWLSRDPSAPRLVYKLSGKALPSKKTALLVTAGFDLERAKRLIDWCKPSVLLVGLQSESLFRRDVEAMNSYREGLQKEYDCIVFDLDAYAEDHGLAAIQRQLGALGEEYNVIMSSLGPKLTAISLYKIQRTRREFGLVYAPSTQYSDDYSMGIGDGFWGGLKFAGHS